MEKLFNLIVAGCEYLVCNASLSRPCAVMFMPIRVVHLGVQFLLKKFQINRLIGQKTSLTPAAKVLAAVVLL